MGLLLCVECIRPENTIPKNFIRIQLKVANDSKFYKQIALSLHVLLFYYQYSYDSLIHAMQL